MHKIMIFGNSGSGKSTLAKQLVEAQQLAHLDLDTLAWQDTNPPSRKPLSESTKAIELFINQNNAWVIEGCYADLLAVAASAASSAIFMDLSVSQCQENAQNRPWEPHKYASKAAQDANLAMLLDWIGAYKTRDDEFSYQAHHNLYQSFNGQRLRITENQSCVPRMG